MILWLGGELRPDAVHVSRRALKQALVNLQDEEVLTWITVDLAEIAIITGHDVWVEEARPEDRNRWIALGEKFGAAVVWVNEAQSCSVPPPIK